MLSITKTMGKLCICIKQMHPNDACAILHRNHWAYEGDGADRDLD